VAEQPMSKKPTYEELEQRIGNLEKESEVRKNIERALRESENRFRRTFDQSPIGAAIIGLDHRFIRANEAFCRFIGYSEEELRALTFSEITHPEDLDTDLEQVQRMEEEEIEQYQTEKRCIRKDGQVVWGRVSYRLIRDENGRILYNLPFVEDITGRKKTEQALRESERKFRNLFDTSLDAIYITSREGEFLDANPTLLELFGYTRDELVHGINAEQIYADPADRLKFQKEIERQGSIRNYEVKFRKKNGTDMDCFLSGTLRLAYDGSVLGYQGIIRDVTEIKRVEHIREDVHRMMRHDLRSPLIGIVGIAGLLLKDDNLTEKQRKSTTMIQDLGERMLGFIDRTRDLFQMEGGNYRLIPQEVDLLGLLRRIEKTLESLTLKKKTGFSYSLRGQVCGQNAEYMISGEEALLEVMFANLIKNAIEASPEGGTVSVSIGTTQRYAKTYHFIDIHNMGVVPLDVRETFFDSYTTSGKEGGTGLGTHSARLVAQTHQGDISFTTSDKEGTHRRIHLPEKIELD